MSATPLSKKPQPQKSLLYSPSSILKPLFRLKSVTKKTKASAE